MARSRRSNLWLADTLWKLGAVQFGDFTLGRSTVHSPVYINLRLLIGHPTALRRVAHVLLDELRTLQQMRHPQVAPFDLVAGVPFGGLHVATAFSLTAKVPMVYLHPRSDGLGQDIEGLYSPSQRVLIMDDLITGGGSILETALHLEECGLLVRDAVVLVDRGQGGRERLRRHGINLVALLTLETLLNYLMSSRKIPEDWYQRSMDFLKSHHGEDLS
ncbi:MAG: phosphoribosyltransferase [Candidatus Bathyarchaeota archaeon]|nr:phosphoribosyltransferase [Candidatus Bathyarchaeota archaeon]